MYTPYPSPNVGNLASSSNSKGSGRGGVRDAAAYARGYVGRGGRGKPSDSGVVQQGKGFVENSKGNKGGKNQG